MKPTVFSFHFCKSGLRVCYSYWRKILTLQTQASVQIPIPKEHHRFILGKGGAKLQELETKTATKISIPKASESNDKITIAGPKEGIDKAIHEIRIISDEQVLVGMIICVFLSFHDDNFNLEIQYSPCELMI